MVHILIVDDDADLRQLVAEFLEAAGHRVQTAPNGHEALAQMRRECPDLVVLDLEMPGMDGRALLRA
jgi:CheY-like chemotaxis protein